MARPQLASARSKRCPCVSWLGEQPAGPGSGPAPRLAIGRRGRRAARASTNWRIPSRVRGSVVVRVVPFERLRATARTLRSAAKTFSGSSRPSRSPSSRVSASAAGTPNPYTAGVRIGSIASGSALSASPILASSHASMSSACVAGEIATTISATHRRQGMWASDLSCASMLRVMFSPDRLRPVDAVLVRDERRSTAALGRASTQ